MCGINGIISAKVNLHKDIKLMNESTSHRGPDDQGVYFNKQESIALGMNRLAILGLNSGSQPMYTNDNKKIVVFNGEIFNFKELCKDHLNSNYESDTKTLIELFDKYGVKSLNLLNGMFSFAFYNLEKKKIYIVRDRYGIKPLYYYFKNKLIFSSEIKAIKKILKSSLDINFKNVSDYITVNHSHGFKTTYEDIQKLPPGHYIEFDLRKKIFSIKKWYFHKLSQINLKNKLEYTHLAHQQIKKSVNLWSKSDVPISFLLSGGMDSGLLVKTFSENKLNEINTISLAFNQKAENKWNEISTINTLIKDTKPNHKTIFFSQKSFLDDFETIISSLDEPYGGGLPSWFVFKQISKNYKVAISGTGGDEIFGNYNRYFHFKNMKCNSKKKKYFNFFYNQYFADNIWKNKFTNLLNFEDTSESFYKKFRKINYKLESKKFSFLDLETQLTDEFLYITDLFSMHHSLEVRTPYLDHELVELIYSFPEKYRISKSIYKPLLRKIGKNLLPKEYITQDKKGFSLPLSLYMRGILKPYVEEYFSRKKVSQIGIIKYDFVESYIKPMLKGDDRYIQLIWNILILQTWANKNL